MDIVTHGEIVFVVTQLLMELIVIVSNFYAFNVKYNFSLHDHLLHLEYCKASTSCKGRGYCNSSGNCVCNSGYSGSNCQCKSVLCKCHEF